jgi:hypothetical protein
VLGTGQEHGELVAPKIAGAPANVLGFAETATGLGHAVADVLGAPYLHSTRRRVPTARPLVSFVEPHSHATDHHLLPEDNALLSSGDTLVLVDDELSTGVTARNTIRALHAIAPRAGYVLAALVDVRGAADVAALDAFAASLGVAVDVVALAAGEVHCPPDLFVRSAAETAAGARTSGRPGQVTEHRRLWPRTVREGGRHGFTPSDAAAARAAAAGVADELAPGLGGRRVLVLGTEELMYAPTLIAAELAARGCAVRVSATTRSPVLVLDQPGYPIRSGLTFRTSERRPVGAPARFAYNIAPGEFHEIVLVVDEAAKAPELITALRAVAPRVHVVVLPTWTPLPKPLCGPSFGSYEADDVRWLLTDLSDVALEAPTEEREEAIQSGGAHYAESLPIEYQPDADYLRLFNAALTESTDRIATAIGVVTELVLAERGAGIVLASLARAGTPIGILMRRWAWFAHRLDVPHYAVSIVRGRGIDSVALRWLAAHHDSRDVVFVDGWTGKGAIVRELRTAIEHANAELDVAFDPALAVLADPGSCTRTFGTRDDFLIPSACLNSTVSGLVSRTVLNAKILAPGQFHGAKYYRALAGVDVSRRLLEVVGERFAHVAADVAARWPQVQAGDRTPTWTGWAEIERICARHGITDPTLVKPGVGETTRVLLRRVPWAVLVRPDAGRDVEHVLLLAERRGAPVQEVNDLAYRCVGLIHPHYTRGATGTDGQAVAT